MNVVWSAIYHDWAVLLPIFICSVLALTVVIERLWFFRRSSTAVDPYIRVLQRELEAGPEAARAAAARQPGLLSELTLDGISILRRHPERFETLFDVSTSLAARKLEKNLAILGTIATISPYLGLFATVVRILLTFGELAQAEAAANMSAVMAGIGSALIATAFGLAVAILAVAANNYFRSRVERFVGDSEVLKLVLVAYADRPGDQQRSASRQAL